MDESPTAGADAGLPGASTQGAGVLGFSGTEATGAEVPAGITHLADDDDSNVAVPLLPATWSTGAAPGGR